MGDRLRGGDGRQAVQQQGHQQEGGGLSAPALTEKDKRDIRFAAEIGADYLAVSFVRNGDDIRLAREMFHEAGGKGGIVAKIERAEALNAVDDIIEAADIIMVARGDLGVEIGDAELPAVQKRLIHRARELNSVVITATQMMQSMIENPIPTRAEVFDVANAVLDGTDAVMLSAETSVGKNPAKIVEAMHRVCLEAEKNAVTRSRHRLNSVFGRGGRGHRHGRHVCRQPPGGEGHRCPDRERLHRQVDVPHQLRHPHLCPDPARADPAQGPDISRRLSDSIRRRPYGYPRREHEVIEEL